MASDPLLIYGAYGYTGELVARRAVERGLKPVLAGRDRRRLEPIALALGLEWRAFGLDGVRTVQRNLVGAKVVLHCAGPFVDTFRPVAEACVASGAHYLDITGELPVFEAIAAMSHAAEKAGVMLLPGAGFDVVPTDCLAAHLVKRLPDATALTLAFRGLSRLSRGTARTMLRHLAAGAPDPRSSTQPHVRAFDFGSGPRPCLSIAWGDLVTAPRTTGVRDVAVYVPAPRRGGIKLLPRLAALARLPGMGAIAIRLLTGGEPGPTPEERARAGAVVLGEASDVAGTHVAARLTTPEPYVLTALSAVEIAERALRGDTRPGWQTPASAYGPELVTGLPGCARTDLSSLA
jgi:short subunit dehydrogenase-like uncharacterized protein